MRFVQGRHDGHELGREVAGFPLAAPADAPPEAEHRVTHTAVREFDEVSLLEREEGILS